METSKKTVIGLITLVVALLLNLGHVIDNYGYGSNRFRSQIFASGSTTSSSSSSTTGTDTSRERLWSYRPVACTDTWKGKASASGCVTIFGKEKCGYGIWASVEYTYKGEKENCTGGHEWYDCQGAQKDCVPTDTF